MFIVHPKGCLEELQVFCVNLRIPGLFVGTSLDHSGPIFGNPLGFHPCSLVLLNCLLSCHVSTDGLLLPRKQQVRVRRDVSVCFLLFCKIVFRLEQGRDKIIHFCGVFIYQLLFRVFDFGYGVSLWLCVRPEQIIKCRNTGEPGGCAGGL